MAGDLQRNTGGGGSGSSSGSGSDGGGEVQKLLSDPAGYVRGQVLTIVVGSILSFLTVATQFGLISIRTVQDSIRSGGSEIASQAGSVGDTFVSVLIETPITEVSGVVEGAGVFAPILSTLIFALVASMTVMLIYATWRAVVIIT